MILLALPMVMLGLVFIAGIWDDEPYGEDPFKGVIASIVAAIFYSSFLILYRYSNRIKAPSANLQFDATIGAAIGLLLIGIAPLEGLDIEPINFTLSWPGHGWLILPAAHTSFAVLLQPVLTIVWGVILLSETPSLQQMVGMTLIFSAIIAVTMFGESQSGRANID